MKHLGRKSILVLFGLFLTFGAVAISAANAQNGFGEPVPIETEVVIPGSDVEKATEGFFRGKVGDLAGYLNIIYTFLISIVGVVAGFAIMIGGYQYLTAGGDAGRVQAAKKRIGNAVIGLALALGSFTLLNTINPQLVNLEVPELTQVEAELAFIPYCEDLLARGLPVTPIVPPDSLGANRECGEIGVLGTTADVEGRAAEKNEEKESDEEESPAQLQGCIFRGNDCGPNPFTTDAGEEFPEYETCMPYNFLLQDQDEFEKFILFAQERGGVADRVRAVGLGEFRAGDNTHADVTNRMSRAKMEQVRSILLEAGLEADEEKELRDWIASFRSSSSGGQKAGRCQTCGGWTSSWVLTEGAGPVRPATCEYWQRYASSGPDGVGMTLREKRDTVAYCGYDDIGDTCVSITFACGADSASNSCSDYKGKKTLFYVDIENAGAVRYGKGGAFEGIGSVVSSFGQVGSHPGVLTDICRENPCGYNSGGECKTSDGTVDAIRSAAIAVRYGTQGSWECYNQ